MPFIFAAIMSRKRSPTLDNFCSFASLWDLPVCLICVLCVIVIVKINLKNGVLFRPEYRPCQAYSKQK